MKRTSKLLMGYLLAATIGIAGAGFILCDNNDELVVYTVEELTTPIERSANILVDEVIPVPEEEIEMLEVVDEPILPIEDIELIALVTMAEAEGECELGKRLVIDTILNRVDSDNFPDTINEVIFQKNQFSSMWNGRVDRCYVTDDICLLVKEELENRTNYEVAYFHANKYGKYGEPLLQVENHYFSKE